MAMTTAAAATGPSVWFHRKLPLMSHLEFNAVSLRARRWRSPGRRVCCSKPRDEAALEEVSRALEIEAIENAVAVAQLDPQVVHQVPLDRRRDSPELAAVKAAAIEIDVRQVQRDLQRAR